MKSTDAEKNRQLPPDRRDGDRELEILKAVAQAWHGHSGNPRPATEFDAVRADTDDRRCRRPTRFRLEAMRRKDREARCNWDFSRSLWDSYEIVTISKKLESNLALDDLCPAVSGADDDDDDEQRRGGKRPRESKNSLRNLLRSPPRSFGDDVDA